MMVTHTHTHTLSSLADRLLEGAGSSNTHQNTEICTHAGDPQGFSHANVSVILIGRLGNFVDTHTLHSMLSDILSLSILLLLPPIEVIYI